MNRFDDYRMSKLEYVSRKKAGQKIKWVTPEGQEKEGTVKRRGGRRIRVHEGDELVRVEDVVIEEDVPAEIESVRQPERVGD